MAATQLWDSSVPGDLDLPDLPAGRYFSAAELEQTRDYQAFLRVAYVLSQVVLIGVLVLYAARGARFARESAAGRIGTGMLLGMLGLGLVWLSQLPFGLATLWWERRHDISDQDYPSWIVDNWLALGGEFLFISLALLIVMALAGSLGGRWWLVGGPAFVAVGALFALAQPYLIPDQRSLRDERLLMETRRLARAQDVPDPTVKVQEVGDFTRQANAAVVGIGPSERVVLWDTLLADPYTRRQVEFVIAHELAHVSRDHVWKGLGWFALFAIPGAFLIELMTRRRGGLAQPAAVPVALLAAVVLQLAASPLQNAISRRIESEADWVALQSARDPAAARALLKQFSATGLEQPRPPGWSYVLLDSHPTIMERIAMAEEWEARAGAEDDQRTGRRGGG